ncbi:MAG: hypothetical protein J6I66_01925 [Lachnospiraceae bacterium]|nr:hypothetical protein [Lachnospiraceae bacterium]
MFIIGETDYSDHVIAGSYKVNNVPVTEDWTDAAGVIHRQKIRDKIIGTFDMWFRTKNEYNLFLECISQNRQPNLTCSVTVEVNNAGDSYTGDFFINHETVRNRDGAWKDYMEVFTVNIEQA